MTLVKFNNTKPSYSNLFDGFFNDFPAVAGNWNNAVPPVNVTETPDSYNLELSVPGRSKEDFKVSIENGLLTISFEKKEEVKNEGVKSIRKEFSYQSFKRSFSLDEKIDAEKIEAKYENGLLKFVLPKKEQTKPATKQIEIQ
jgi:HSP20 family protein